MLQNVTRCLGLGIIRVMKLWAISWACHVARMGEKRSVYRILMGKPRGRGPLATPRRSQEEIKYVFSRKWIEGRGLDPDWSEYR